MTHFLSIVSEYYINGIETAHNTICIPCGETTSVSKLESFVNELGLNVDKQQCNDFIKYTILDDNINVYLSKGMYLAYSKVDRCISINSILNRVKGRCEIVNINNMYVVIRNYERSLYDELVKYESDVKRIGIIDENTLVISWYTIKK